MKIMKSSFLFIGCTIALNVACSNKEGMRGKVDTPVSPQEIKTSEIVPHGTFIIYPNGVVRDTEEDLEWVAGPDRDMSWEEAQKWVRSLTIGGGGWRMPTLDELAVLSKKELKTFNGTPPLKTNGVNVWSAEIKDSSSAWFFSFYFGYKYWHKRSESSTLRAYAVRSLR